jgi:phosphopantetheinyl transferase
MKIIDIPAEWRERAIVVLDEPLQMSWFSDEELRAADHYRHEKRRAEFFLSRAAAKQLAVDLGLAPRPEAVRIAGDRRVGPRHVSLSHSAPYAAAAIDEGPVGIDAQVVRDISERAAHLFLSDREEALMQATRIADRMIHFWCAKEAAWKREGGAILTLKGVPLSLEEVSPRGLRFADVETTRVGDLVVALTRRSS